MAPLAPEVPVLGAADEVPAAPEPAVSQALVMMSLPPTAASPLPSLSAPAAVLERALAEMTQLQADVLSAEPRLVAGRLEPASGWLHPDLAVRAALGQAAAASEKEKQGAASAAADREVALKDAKAVRDRCQELEGELQSLRDKHAEEVHCRQAKEEEMKAREEAVKNRDAELAELGKKQAAERNRLEELERKMGTREADLDAKARVLAEDRVAFADLEKRSRKALKTLYEHGLEKPLDTDEDGPAQLLPLVVKALEEVVDGLGPMAEAEARVLSSAAPTRVFSHLHLCDPNACLDELLEPAAEDQCEAAAAAVQDQVGALLRKFRGFVFAPLSGDVVDLAAGGEGEDKIFHGGAPFAGDGDV